MRCGFQDVHLEIHSTIESLEIVQAVTERVGRQLGFDEESLHWMAMAVRESVVNAITHGNRNDPSKRVFIGFTAMPESHPSNLVVSVRDQGSGFDPDMLGDPLAPENKLKSSGRGIFLIRQFMDEVSIARTPEGATEMRMVKHLRTI
jgi:serine/threonine-protein kinase RsbW